MEFHAAKSVGTLMERIFRQCEIPEGTIQSKQIPSLLQSLHPDLTIDEKELQKLITECDRDGSGILDFDSMTKIIFNLLLKQSSDIIDNELHSDEKLTLDDFVIFNNV